MFSTFMSDPTSLPNWRSQPRKHRTHRPMPQWVSFSQCLLPSLSGKLLVWSQCNTLSCSASAACLQCADFDCCNSSQTCKNQVTTFRQSQGGSNAKDLTLSDANHIWFWPHWSHLKVDISCLKTPWNSIAKLPHFMWNIFKCQFTKGQEREISKCQVEISTHIFLFYTFSTFSSSGGGPQMYSITDVSRGLKRSAGYSVKPLSSTNSDKSRPPKYLVETNFKISDLEILQKI